MPYVCTPSSSASVFKSCNPDSVGLKMYAVWVSAPALSRKRFTSVVLPVPTSPLITVMPLPVRKANSMRPMASRTLRDAYSMLGSGTTLNGERSNLK
jgi:hypothetical protein